MRVLLSSFAFLRVWNTPDFGKLKNEITRVLEVEIISVFREGWGDKRFKTSPLSRKNPHDRVLDTWFSGREHWLPFQRSWVRFPTPTWTLTNAGFSYSRGICCPVCTDVYICKQMLLHIKTITTTKPSKTKPLCYRCVCVTNWETDVRFSMLNQPGFLWPLPSLFTENQYIFFL